MAIIDTSKGVRPCVEELARLENNKVFGEMSNIIPTWAYKAAPDFITAKNGYTSHGVIYKYEGCGIFSTTGTYNNWSGYMYFSFPLSINASNFYRIEETDNAYLFKTSFFIDSRCKNDGNIEDLVYRQIELTVSLPLSNGEEMTIPYTLAVTNIYHLPSEGE